MKNLSAYIEGQAARLQALLAVCGKTVTFAESCTGGMLAASFTANSGASQVLKQSYITYCDDAKADLLGVSRTDLSIHTAVSAQVAAQMAAGARRAAAADLAISVTGLAGPGGGTADRPVGLVYIGAALADRLLVKKYVFPGDRQNIRLQAATAAYGWALRLAKENF